MDLSAGCALVWLESRLAGGGETHTEFLARVRHFEDMRAMYRCGLFGVEGFVLWIFGRGCLFLKKSFDEASKGCPWGWCLIGGLCVGCS